MHSDQDFLTFVRVKHALICRSADRSLLMSCCVHNQPQMPVELGPAPRLLSFDMDSAHNQPERSEMLSLALFTKPQRDQLQALQTYSDASIRQNNRRWGAASNTLTLQGSLAELCRDIVKALSSLSTVSIKARKAERFCVLCCIVRCGWYRLTLPST